MSVGSSGKKMSGRFNVIRHVIAAIYVLAGRFRIQVQLNQDFSMLS